MKLLAFDLGAESGRALVGDFSGGILAVDELHRFVNEPVFYNGSLHWDMPKLWLEMRRALSIAGGRGLTQFDALGVDTWGLDFALLGDRGSLLENPFHYRDGRTDRMVEEVCSIVPAEEIYAQTGIQFMQINALYQLYAEWRRAPRIVASAEHLVTIPDLLNFWLTGTIACEYTNATTTQFFNPVTHEWARPILERLGIPTHFLTEVVEPGTTLGLLQDEIVRSCGVSATVVAPACHDTGSAVAAIPMHPKAAYISSGTWSLLGTEIHKPVLTDEAQRLNFTNEGGVGGTIRLLKNITGMWLLQGCRRYWEGEGKPFEYPVLMEAAKDAAPLHTLIDPDHPSFLRTAAMPSTIDDFCRRTGQPKPAHPGSYARTVLESLALKYRYVLDSLESLTGSTFEEIRIVGGGARNHLLNQFTADATGKRVVAGPVEATALGNMGVQLLAIKAVSSLSEARSIIDRSFPTEVFEPKDTGNWNKAYASFRQYCGGVAA